MTQEEGASDSYALSFRGEDLKHFLGPNGILLPPWSFFSLF
jgi:hypothetical protein